MCVVRLLRGIGLMPALICAAASFYLAAPSAATADECKPIEEVVALVEAQKGRVVRVLVGDQAQHWLDVVNHQPPETEFKGDRIMIAWVPDIPVFLAFTITEGRTCRSLYLGRRLMQEVMEQALGRSV